MSCDEWERATLYIPAAAWAKLKRDLREAYNKAIATDYEYARQLHAAAKAKGRGESWRRTVEVLSRERLPVPSWGYSVQPDRFPFVAITSWRVVRLLAPEGRDVLLMPKKKDFARATNKTNTFYCDNASINLEDANRTLTWNVSEGNHACEYANAHPFAKVMWRLVEQIQWTRGSGGTVVGNDEYRRESREAGDGSNYVKRAYGPLGKRAREDMARWR